ncbi:polyribonucleotide nucleotidyltransferase [Rickettsia endosymbiont of Cardiosporidium cionae]|uniref:polyribonucleotide nucleotidyltransferase n=1 Tax=Rickettsia endosymbiont of Cardiosporidium cionae TaxID=2777155 RepID=UPI0018948B31|nr:polyribonucleotide nucleotidyltransferase [Rickettsia endosymbiont of Cardiosporidium cionae]KAF8818647.1 polyribonucleotide nucleotidyltransferase [Rickettsia endosymbiont of Cardiosporidium cionae]
MFNETIKKIDWNGNIIELSTGKIARQATSSVLVKMGNTSVLCTVVIDKQAKQNIDFVPLTVNYQEQSYAAGRIPGGYMKREGNNSEREVIVSRLIDRSVRTLLGKNFNYEIQIICTVISYDSAHNPDVLSLIGASAALSIANIPSFTILASCRIGYRDNKLTINPSIQELASSKLDLIISSTKDSVIMLESGCGFLAKSELLKAIKLGQESIQPVIQLIEDFSTTVLNSQSSKQLYQYDILENTNKELKAKIESLATEDIINNFRITDKSEKYEIISNILDKIKSHDSLKELYTEEEISLEFLKVRNQLLSDEILNKKIRIDGRTATEIRNIASEVSLLKSTHGSSLFTRGETQALSVTTLGTAQDEKFIDGLEDTYKESFLLEYVFPPYSTGDIAGLRAPSRREIGHGKLAWKALKSALPTKVDHFPYTIKIVSKITESNGSSSMATVCAASMSMMDAGIPIKEHIAGIAMGLVKNQNEYLILSDIAADEDYMGCMDFKIAGTRESITALQMDVKSTGVSIDIIEQIIDQATVGINFIVDKMDESIKSPNELSPLVPVFKSMKVNHDHIKKIIGFGGRTIKEISSTTNTNIEIIDDKSVVSISSTSKDNIQLAVDKINDIIAEPKIGTIFEGKVVKIIEAGAFINYVGSKEGFVHISEIDKKHINKVEDVLHEGQMVNVKIIGVDRSGKVKLTIKNLHNDIDFDSRKDRNRSGESNYSNTSAPNNRNYRRYNNDNNSNVNNNPRVGVRRNAGKRNSEYNNNFAANKSFKKNTDRGVNRDGHNNSERKWFE